MYAPSPRRMKTGSSRPTARLALVEEALCGRCFHHRVLAGDVVRRERQLEALARGADDVEVRQRRLDHQDVRSFGDVLLALAQSLAHVRGIHLVAAAVTECGCALGRLA